jgi:methanogenic corrinoid protein MtbC1
MVFTRAGFLPGLLLQCEGNSLIELIGKKMVSQFFTSKGFHLCDRVVAIVVQHFAEKVAELIQHNRLLLVFFTTNKSSFEEKVGFFYLA